MKKFVLVLALLAVATAPAMAASYLETFSGSAPWTGTNAGVTVDAGSALLTYDNADRGELNTIAFSAISGSTVYWHLDVFSGGQAIDGNAFDIRLEDATAKGLARWYGGAYWERPRIGDTGYVLGNLVLTEGIWNSLDVVLSGGMAEFKLNGVSAGSLNYAAATGAGDAAQVRLGFQNAGTAQNGATKRYDNLYVGDTAYTPVPEPSSLAALGVFGMGLIGTIRRRRS